MRVALLCPYSLSRPGGVQGQVVGLGRALAHSGHDVSVLAPFDAGGSPTGVEIVPGGARGSLRIVRLGGSVGIPANGSVAPLALAPSAVVRALRAVRPPHVEVLHLHEPFAPGPAPACLLAARVPMVGTFHRAGAGLSYRVLAPVLRAGARRLAVRCAVSEEAAATARRVLGGTYEVVGNGIDTDRFATAEPWPTTGPTVLFVGRHEERKGLGVLLDALAHAPAFTAWVAGEGPGTAGLRRRHPGHDRLVWLGRLSEHELSRRLAGAHVLCAPSLGGESFGVVLLEAMAAGTAVVASALPGYVAVVGHHGVLVPPGDTSALGSALALLAHDAASGSGRCAPDALDAARAHAAQWSMAGVAGRYAAIYARAVAGAPAPSGVYPPYTA